MPSLSLNVGLNNGRKLPFGGGAAPSGIVAATAGDLNISFGYFNPATYTKLSNTWWQYDYGDDSYHRLTWNTDVIGTWALDANSGEVRATNPSLDSTIIPTTGWIYIIGTGPTVTITAA
jgi:hypothetical protein